MEDNILKNKKLVIFDLDGTVIDSMGVWNDVDVELIRKLGGIPDENISLSRSEILHKNTKGNIYLNYCEFLKEKYNSNLSREEILELRIETADSFLINKVHLKENVDKLLLMLYEKGYIIALATSSSRRAVNIYFNKNKNILSKIDLSKIFSYTLTKEDVEMQKPDPEIFLKCANHFNLKPTECLVVEDSLVGVTAGKKAGMDVVCIYDEHSKKDLEKIKGVSNIFVKDYNELIALIK